MHKEDESVARKLLVSITGLALGILAGVGTAVLFEKRQEEKVGGKLMNVHYRFTKNFED